MGFCTKASSVLQIIGYVILIVKIVIPLIIIILGSIDLGGAVIAGEDKAIKDNAYKLLKRLLIAIVIFLLPTIVRVIYFSLNTKADEELRNETTVCIDCLTKPGECQKSEREILK